ncbi:hypothetical protein [Nonomuraea sp. NPDC049695]|uniref:hypothetical protein n=1 Tax=Nonomuraea sp. NPDC049695 TaxID=3154734 RepID=UPI00344682E5
MAHLLVARTSLSAANARQALAGPELGDQAQDGADLLLTCAVVQRHGDMHVERLVEVLTC